MENDHIVLRAPSALEGEPQDVLELTKQDLRVLGAATGPFVAQAFVQLRAAGIGELTVEEWELTPEGEAATELRMRATAFIQSIRRVVGS